MDKRWAAIRVLLLLLYLGTPPLLPEAPPPFALVLLALAVVTAGLLLHWGARVQSRRSFAPDKPAAVDFAEPALWQLPLAPGEPGTVRARAPARLNAALV